VGGVAQQPSSHCKRCVSWESIELQHLQHSTVCGIGRAVCDTGQTMALAHCAFRAARAAWFARAASPMLPTVWCPMLPLHLTSAPTSSATTGLGLWHRRRHLRQGRRRQDRHGAVWRAEGAHAAVRHVCAGRQGRCGGGADRAPGPLPRAQAERVLPPVHGGAFGACSKGLLRALAPVRLVAAAAVCEADGGWRLGSVGSHAPAALSPPSPLATNPKPQTHARPTSCAARARSSIATPSTR